MTVIQAMEAGQLQWGDTERILAIQRQHSRSAAATNPSPRRVSTTTHTANGIPSPLYCGQFQSNTCDKPTDHPSPEDLCTTFVLTV